MTHFYAVRTRTCASEGIESMGDGKVTAREHMHAKGFVRP